ncbi:MAG: hypothetical protein HYY46_07545 [Deltaproteobacteria bacterium]|nr:hypothetical protein [Deltaproteobacteria bacterium]
MKSMIVRAVLATHLADDVARPGDPSHDVRELTSFYVVPGIPSEGDQLLTGCDKVVKLVFG